MDRVSPVTSQPSFAERACLGVGIASVLGALAWVGFRVTGRSPGIAARAFKYIPVGLCVGAAGLVLREVNKDPLALLAAMIPSGTPTAAQKEYEESKLALEVRLHCEINEHSKAWELAEKFGNASDDLPVFTRYMRSHMLKFDTYNKRLGEDSEGLGGESCPIREIQIWEGNFGFSHETRDKPLPEALGDALLAILQEESAKCQPRSTSQDEETPPVGIVVRICHHMENTPQLLKLLEQVENLVALDCSNYGYNGAEAAMKKLLEACPKLVAVPHLGRRMGLMLADDPKSQQMGLDTLAFCDFVDAKVVERLPTLRLTQEDL